MSYFPFMIELNNERCLIAGGGTVAYRKVCSMLEFGAVVTVVSPEFCPELLELVEQVNTPDKYCAATSDDRGSVENFADYSGCLTLVKRRVQPQDIDGAFVVIMATDDEKVNHDMAELCRQQRILVNVVDVKSDCGFYFPAIIKRNIESHLGRSYGDIAERMGELREQIKAQIDGEEERKKAFQQMVRSLLDES